MKPNRILSVGSAFLFLCLLAPIARGQPGRPPMYRGDDRYRQDPGQVLTRGPVHEAFAETVLIDPEPTSVVRQPPPDPIEEMPPDERPDGNNIAWIPGYWAWDDEQGDYFWISGVWRAIPPGREWVPGYWSRVDSGYRWIAGYWADVRSQEISYLPEPPETMDIGPSIAAPADDYIWVPGSWVWHNGRYAWRPGYWMRAHRDWMWVPAHYVWTPRGYVYSEGYWDYDVQRRGVLFAPVRFEPEVYHRSSFAFSPSIVINLAVCLDQLFLRPRDCHYYFGDYYASSYREAGFIPGCEVRSYRYAYDPVFVHERFAHRSDRDWDRRIEKDYAYRRDHADARPPRTFSAFNALASSGKVDPKVAIATALNQFASHGNSPLQFRKVAENDRKTIARKSQDVVKFMGERRQLESTGAVKPVAANNQAQQPVPVKLPRSPIVAQGKTNIAPPTIQQPPQPDTKVQPQPRKRSPEELRRQNEPIKSAQPIKPVPSEPIKTQPQPVKPVPSEPIKPQPQPVKPIPKSEPPPKAEPIRPQPQPIKPLPPPPKQEPKPQPIKPLPPPTKPEPKPVPPPPKPEPKPLPPPPKGEPKPQPKPEPPAKEPHKPQDEKEPKKP